MQSVHAGLDACLNDPAHPPLVRVRRFFEMTQRSYRKDGYLGCLLGGLGQELSGMSDVFRLKIESCLSTIASRGAAEGDARLLLRARGRRLNRALRQAWAAGAFQSAAR